MVKKKIEIKKEEDKILGMKKNTALTIGALLVVVILLNNYNNVPTGQASRGQVYQANLYTLVTNGWVGNAGRHQVEVLSVQYDANAIVVSIDGGNPKTVWKTGCAENNEGIFVGNERYNSEGIPEGVTIKVCAVGTDNANVILIPET